MAYGEGECRNGSIIPPSEPFRVGNLEIMELISDDHLKNVVIKQSGFAFRNSINTIKLRKERIIPF